MQKRRGVFAKCMEHKLTFASLARQQKAFRLTSMITRENSNTLMPGFSRQELDSFIDSSMARMIGRDEGRLCQAATVIGRARPSMSK